LPYRVGVLSEANMSEKRASLEVIAPTVEEAVAKGLDDLGLTEDAVDVEVLDPGSRGLFGLGSRHARVRLTIKSSRPAEAKQSMPAGSEAEAVQAKPADAVASPLEEEPHPEENESVETTFQAEEQEEWAGDEETEHILHVAQDTVSELLDKMRVHALVSAHYGTSDDPHSRPPVMVEVHGDDLSILIGPRAETLNALQYISGLIVGKELGHSVSMIVDVEGYRARREQQIRQLARRMADQAIKTGRRQVLEPMPANERRLVHIELRDNPDVTTQSIGEEPRRKVTIIPEK
jgi:spoIIIJ-associated protein